MNARTDLAVELTENIKTENGIIKKTRSGAFCVTEIEIVTDEAAKLLGKPIGRYITLESDSLSDAAVDIKGKSCMLCRELKNIIPKNAETVLAACLGNRNITPDAYGPMTAEKIVATRHLTGMEGDFFKDLRAVSVLAGGVLAQTGIESSELIKAAAEKIGAQCIIAIDALACRSSERLGRTVQISDSGICPGSGVENKRKEITKRTMGIPVIAVGVPTVMDFGEGEEKMMITMRDIDRVIENAAMITGYAVDMAMQEKWSYDDAAAMSR